MTFAIFWTTGAILCAVFLILGIWWSMRNARLNPSAFNENDRCLTLSQFIVGVILVLCPVINFVVATACALYFFAEIAPNIVLFGNSK